VHFPTDLNLLWDASRKCLDTIKKLKEEGLISGWRKLNFIRQNLKSIFRATSQQVFRGKTEEQKKQRVKEYLKVATDLHERFLAVSVTLKNGCSLETLTLSLELEHYNSYVNKMIDLIHRRLIKGEVIAACEKIYSIFEPHTEWISKGKLNRSVELGHLLLITTDQNHFIVDYKVMEHEKDASQVKSLMVRIKGVYSDQKIHSHSFDKGFYSKDNLELLHQSGIENVILPKKGKLNQAEKEREGSAEFRKLRRAHSAVESNINMLEHHGLNRCPDKGLRGYKKYVGLSVLAYNLHILGNYLNAEKIKKEEKLSKQRIRYRLAA